MTKVLPHDALWAEVAAWPLASEAAFRGRTLHLELSSGLVPSGATEVLWRALEEELRHRAGRTSVATLVPLRDQLWFTPPSGALGEQRLPLAGYLERLVDEVLDDDGISCHLRPAADVGPETIGSARTIERWRWLSARLPPSLLLAGAAVRNRRPVRDRVDLLPSSVARLLGEQPVAELHLHVGAGPDFESLWDTLTLGGGLTKQPDVDAPGGPSFGRLVLAANFARRVLTDHAFRRAPTVGLAHTLVWHSRDMAVWVGRRPVDWRRDAETFLGLLDGNLASPATETWMKRALARMAPARATLRHNVLLARILSDLKHYPADAELERVFWQYVRIHALLYRYLVNDPSSCGLDWFSRHYRRISPVSTSALKASRFAKTYLNDGAGLRLACLEIRTAPEADWIAIRREVQGYAREAAGLGESLPEWGIVFHVIKESVIDGRRAGAAGLGGRYIRWYLAARRKLDALGALLRREPELLTIIRGVDVANLELAVPTWIVAPLLQRVVEQSLSVASADGPPLATAPHVGEDYRRLAEGLRRLDEALLLGVVGRGSRVGHALALGEEPERWCQRHPVVTQPCEERLFDLLWERSLLERGLIASTAARAAWVAAEARNLGEQLFDRSVRVNDLVAAYRRLVQRGHILRVGYGRQVPRPSGDDYVRRWLFDDGVHRRGQTSVRVVSTAEECAMLAEAQAAIARAYVAAGISVECNLSSNLLVGGLDSFAAHPMLRWQPLVDVPGSPRIGITLNSDDPITFATRLADEYAYAYHALVRVGATNEQALDWLDRVRRMGWLARFTVPASRHTAQLRRFAGRR